MTVTAATKWAFRQMHWKFLQSIRDGPNYGCTRSQYLWIRALKRDPNCLNQSSCSETGGRQIPGMRTEL